MELEIEEVRVKERKKEKKKKKEQENKSYSWDALDKTPKKAKDEKEINKDRREYKRRELIQRKKRKVERNLEHKDDSGKTQSFMVTIFFVFTNIYMEFIFHGLVYNKLFQNFHRL